VVEWTNEIGEVHSITKSYELNPIETATAMPPRQQGIVTPTNLVIVTAVTAIGVFAIYRKRRKRKNEGSRTG